VQPYGKSALEPKSAVVDSKNLEATVCHGEDDLQLLRSFPAGSVDLVYLDPPFFSDLVDESSWALKDLHRVLKPNGALFLVCDEVTGLQVRLQLDELFSQRDAHNRMIWRKADSGPAHHHVFYYRKSDHPTGRQGHPYTVIHREGEDDWSLVAFSFVQGRRMGSRAANHCAS
jgi:hypothetical protein